MKLTVLSLLLLALAAWSDGSTSAQPASRTALALAIAVVEGVVDGDTFDVRYVLGGEGLPTRIEPYLTVAPRFSPGGPFAPASGECYGEEAKALAERYLEGQTLWLTHQGRTRTQNFIERLRAFVYLDSERTALLQAIQVSQGGARVAVAHPEETPFLSTILRMENEARSAQRGLWDACG